ncbi:BON domain-containing protein [Cupriavidus campinensis]|uniref:BON domain-containing protein n=1 Tax=Cupriavidus campinensis TaxID=151783 RepID=UPI0024E1EB0D|nr:BON domain-containing protein [Cupriavidus campinensis]
MGDHYTERYRRGQTWRAVENVRDDDAYDPWSDDTGLRAREQDWQPESASDEWDDARRRQRLIPGQTSDGSPPRSGYAGAYRDSGQWQGSNLRYGLNGGYASSDSPEEDAQRRQQAYRSRRQASEFGDYGDYGDYGGPQGYRGYQGYQEARGYGGERGWEQDQGQGRGQGRGQRQQQGHQGERGQQGFGSADQQWLRRAQQREPWQAGGSGHDAYFNDLRSDTRYWTEPRDEWGESRPSGAYAGRQPPAQSYGRNYLGASGYDEELGYRPSRRRADDDDDRDQGEEHGALYNLGHRIGEAVSNFFGLDDDDIDKRNVPRGYTRTDERIRDQICERLTFTSGVDVGEVSVDVDKGKVTLSGTVHQRSQKYAIEDIADNTFGVTEVENNIRVEKREARAGEGTSAGSNGW